MVSVTGLTKPDAPVSTRKFLLEICKDKEIFGGKFIVNKRFEEQSR